MTTYWVMSPTFSWRIPLVFGLLVALLGILLFLFPEQSLRFFLFLIGLFALVIGILFFAIAWRMARGGGGFYIVPLVIGVMACILGLVSFLNPRMMGFFFAVLFALLFILAGLIVLFWAIFSKNSLSLRILSGAGGVFLTALGIGILFSPEVTAQAVVQLVGLILIIIGIATFILGLLFSLRSRQPVIQEIG